MLLPVSSSLKSGVMAEVLSIPFVEFEAAGTLCIDSRLAPTSMRQSRIQEMGLLQKTTKLFQVAGEMIKMFTMEIMIAM